MRILAMLIAGMVFVSVASAEELKADEPPVDGVTMRELAEPLPEVPAALAKMRAEADCIGGFEPIAISLSETQVLWGICVGSGAYNVFYDFFLVEGDEVRPVNFELPPTLGESGKQLVNPELADDGLSISSWDMARGLGDCGSYSAWAWDGADFRLVKYAAMEQCTGVELDDWPVLYRAKLQ